MSTRDLYPYQTSALNELLLQTQTNMRTTQTKKNLILRSVTGSGKTFIAANYIDRISRSSNDICFIWFTIGFGGLHRQSYENLSEMLPNNQIMGAEDAVLQSHLEPGDVVVVNWEAANSTQNDEFVNKLMRTKEKESLPKLLEATRATGTQIIAIVDEYHRNVETPASQMILREVDPIFIVGLTATPKMSQTLNSSLNTIIQVDTEQVIKRGVIKKKILFNEEVEQATGEDFKEKLLNAALTLREELTEEFQNVEANVNPLCLIQIPDGRRGEETKDMVMEYLENNGVSFHKVKTWFSGERNDVLGIEDNDSPVEFLIFKKAITTGWDCPRAHILVKLTELTGRSSSETFNDQLLGRILRMPEREHYENEKLNTAYVFTNDRFDLEAIRNGGEVPSILIPEKQVVLDQSYKQVFEIAQLPNEKWETVPLRTNNRRFKERFYTELDKYTFDLTNLSEKITYASATEDMAFYFNDETGRSQEDKDVVMTDRDIEFYLTQLIESIASPLYSINTITSLITNYISSKGTFSIAENMLIALRNKNYILQAMDTIKREDQATILATKTPKTPETYFVLEDRIINKKETQQFASNRKNAYSKHLISSFTTEVHFEAYLESHPEVEFWFKNADSGPNALSIRYEYTPNGGLIEKKEFYPDYVVVFKDSDIGLYEVKSISDREEHTYTAAKSLAANAYVEKYNLSGTNTLHYQLIKVDNRVIEEDFAALNSKFA